MSLGGVRGAGAACCAPAAVATVASSRVRPARSVAVLLWISLGSLLVWQIGGHVDADAVAHIALLIGRAS